MEKQIVTSKKFTLDWRDLTKGLVMAVLTAALTAAESSYEAGDFQLNWKKMGIAALIGASAYLIKNLFTPAEVKTKVQ